MPKKQSTKQPKVIKDLPKEEEKLSAGDMKKVRGGVVVSAATGIKPGDGSVKKAELDVTLAAGQEKQEKINN